VTNGCKRYGKIKIMNQFNTENVSYMDEFPHLTEKLRIQRLSEPRSIGAKVLQFSTREEELEGLRTLMEEPPQPETLF